MVRQLRRCAFWLAAVLFESCEASSGEEHQGRLRTGQPLIVGILCYLDLDAVETMMQSMPGAYPVGLGLEKTIVFVPPRSCTGKT